MMVLRMIIAVVALAASTGLQAHAMEHYTNTVKDQYGKVVGGASVTVYLTGTTTLATIYSDNGVTTKSNPFKTDTISGVVEFYAANGVYDLAFSYPGKTFTANHTKGIPLFDYRDIASTSQPQSPFVGQLAVSVTDSTSGACDFTGGVAVTLCIWSGIAWEPIAGGTGGSSGTTGWPTTRTGEIWWANSIDNAAVFGDGVDKIAIYKDPTLGIIATCVIGGVENACDHVVRLSSGFYWGIQNNLGASLLRVDNDTGRVTNGIIREEKWFPVASVQNGVGSLIFNTPATNPATAGAIVGTNVITGVADFNDTTANSFQDEWILPAGFTGSMDISFRWVAASTTGSVAWCAQLVRIAVSGSIDPAFPAVATGNCVSDTANGSTNTENLATITGVTCTSCVAGDRVAVRISRDPAEVSTRTDTMTGNARLIEYGRVWDRVLQ